MNHIVLGAMEIDHGEGGRRLAEGQECCLNVGSILV
jgi:hypothetical protein